MKSFFPRFRKRIPRKNRGDVLVITLILSAFMLLVGLALSRFLLQDLYFVRNLLWSETAYFAAESGVEEALLELKENPIKNISGEDRIVQGNVKSVLTVENLKEEHVFTLKSNETKRFRLERDGYAPATNWVFESDNGPLSWRIICQKNKPSGDFLGNVALQGRFNSAQPAVNFGAITGNLDDVEIISGTVTDIPTAANVAVSTFFGTTINTPEEQKTCFVNYQNLSGDTLNVILKNTSGGITPDTAVIKSVGQAGQKEKVIYYQFTQSGLSSFFDFGVLLTE